MDVILLQYFLNKHGIENRALCEAMGWSDVTRRTRIAGGVNWRVDELHVLMTLGLTKDEIDDVFFREGRK